MPRVKCYFCENTLVAKPLMLKKEGYVPRCVMCNDGSPPEGWRCQAITKSTKKQCKRWVMGKGEKSCKSHEVKR